MRCSLSSDEGRDVKTVQLTTVFLLGTSINALQRGLLLLRSLAKRVLAAKKAVIPEAKVIYLSR